ncbi:MAG: CoA transferase, partial [Holophagales bacterium]|nr:CoA transferase [Holophagales bacterium]
QRRRAAPPAPGRLPVCDTVGGMNAAFAILVALYHRERTGEGQAIDVALLDSIMPLMGWVAANLLIGGAPPVAIGNDNFTAAPSGMFRTQDGFVNIAANKQEQWESVCDVLGVPELKTDPRFAGARHAEEEPPRADAAPRGEARRKDPRARGVALLNAKDVPSGDILTLEAALKQPQVVHRKTLENVETPGIGTLPLFNLTAKLEKTPGSIDAPPPRLGAHTARSSAGSATRRRTSPA